MANYMLGSVPEVRPLFFLVDPFNTKDSTIKNISSLSKAVRWLKKGGMLVLFPAGEVSHLRLNSLKIEDPKWNPTMARMVHLIKSPVLPIYFKGRNSALFQLAGMIHPFFAPLCCLVKCSRKSPGD